MPTLSFYAQAGTEFAVGSSVARRNGVKGDFGCGYTFGQPPPPAAAARFRSRQPARSYLVFFDWDKATLTDRARQIIREAADNSTKVQYTRIEVNGYTDTSGTPRYNQGLSVRRARAVQAELVKDGVPANAITIQGFGETHLLVPTGARCARTAEPSGRDHHSLISRGRERRRSAPQVTARGPCAPNAIARRSPPGSTDATRSEQILSRAS